MTGGARARNELVQRLAVRHPIIQAPMGGGPSTPGLAAAVSNAGGLGSLAGGYLGPEQILDELERTRALTDRPFAINLFAGGQQAQGPLDSTRIRALLAPVHADLGLPPPELPQTPPNRFAEQVEAVLQSAPPVVSFTFGIPPKDVIDQLHRLDVVVLGTATVPVEAKRWAEAGADGVVAQGEEAGAHRGTFAAAFEDALIPTDILVESLRETVAIPVIASGGLMDGRDIAQVIRLGASAVQMGTAFLTCPESGASETYKRALLAAGSDTTVITRAFSGRPARGLRNAVTDLIAEESGAILPYPAQNALTRAMRDAAARLDRPEYLSLWAGRGAARVRNLPAAELVAALARECEQALAEEA